MTFEDLYQELAKLPPAVRKNHDLTVFNPSEDDEYYAASITIKINDGEGPLGDALDVGHPIMCLTYIG